MKYMRFMNSLVLNLMGFYATIQPGLGDLPYDQTQVEQYKIAGKLAAQAQKNRFNPKNQKTKKWNTRATEQNTLASSGLSKARGIRASQRIKDQLHKIAMGFLANQLFCLRVP